MKKENATQHTLRIKNEPGAIHKATQVLAEAGINIKGVMAHQSGEVLILRVLTDSQETQARRALQNAGYDVSDHPCLRLEMPNRPGEFSRLCAALAEQEIRLLGAFGTTDGAAHAKLVLAVDQPERAAAYFAKRAEAAAPAV